MFIQLKYIIITATLIIILIWNLSANRIESSNQLNNTGANVPAFKSQQQIIPQVSSTPELDIFSLASGVTFLSASYDNYIIRDSDLNKYNFLITPGNIEKIDKKILYEKYGFNKTVEKHIHFYSQKNKDDFHKQLSRTGKYIVKMVEIFRERGLPQELAFLPLIESGFRLHAYSPKKAAGPWQFIPATAKKYGLKINWWVDERRDPIKSTAAAAEHLRDLYELFNSWNLALAAYNAGEGTIRWASKRARSKDFWKLSKTRYLKRETKNYVPSYIAAVAIASDPVSFGFNNVVYHSPLEYDETVIHSPMDLAVVAEFTGVEIEDIKELNPELRRWCTPPNVSSYTLRLPVGTKETFHNNLLNTEDYELLLVEFYTIKKGDTVWDIAKRFDVPVQAIIDLNSLDKKAFIRDGSRIIIPAKRDTNEEDNTSSYLKPVLKRAPRKKSI